MRVSIDGEEPVRIHFNQVEGFRVYLTDYPTHLPSWRGKAFEHSAIITCGDESAIELFEAENSYLLLRYTSPSGRTWRYLLQYHTLNDGWTRFLSLVSGDYQPG